ncbi:lactate/malate family dehydrogenase [Limosilactobacillus fastidiosus]|uniref:Malate dehydrogenase n=1 Tax=Limosilactobacillus fastidiosus TaxID=2759855 RepID=A0A7W3YCB4_9LACO|nr:malate dehydrogenase [Limosilactobacillus fastidiosus]MBB1086040.1 malate dehydrogenase [Limosilactobacillus fastidiosus]MCD7085619.1 malate dehydrogenase [Limosilactobacillus fastidiosus]MCD7114173.1 malate dehydrogenase [Limosilactobacillus fastidiosus]MCD7116693.1 malate dehydrogenase [Limosilactobacillus fastidiosus]
MRKIGIIGLGHVGRLLAHDLVIANKTDQLVLIDRDDALAVGLKTDLENAQTALNTRTKIILQDYAALRNVDILITTFGNSSLLKKEQMAELIQNGEAVREIAPLVKQSGFDGIVLNISDPNEAITAYLQQQLALPTEQVIGIGTTIDTARMRQSVAKTAELSSQNVSGFVYGQHNGDKVFAWSTVTVNGQKLDESINGHHLDQNQLRINADLDNWYTFKGLGYSASAIVAWTLKIISAILGDGELSVSVAIYQPQYSGYVSFPTLLNRNGQGHPLLFKLYSVEAAAVKTAVGAIQQQLTVLQQGGKIND